MSFGNAESQQVEKKQMEARLEAKGERSTINLGVAQQVAGEFEGELYIIYTPCGSCQNAGSQWIKVNTGLISIKLNK